jgi:hypothetical protein
MGKMVGARAEAGIGAVQKWTGSAALLFAYFSLTRNNFLRALNDNCDLIEGFF